jgi:acyl dehydratase
MNVNEVLSYSFPRVTRSYDDTFTMLYALSIGFGTDPTDECELPYVYEEGSGLRSFPTIAVVLGSPGFWARDPRFGIDWKRVLHGEQALEVHRQLPPSGTVNSDFQVVAIDDKGGDKGAVIHTERTLSDGESGERLATLRQTTFARGDGGFGGDNPKRGQQWTKPTRDPEHVCALPTAANSALIYRLTGDRNPLHAEPAVARAAGFERPILHGLCTYGVVARAVTAAVANHDASRLESISGRFSSPVIPGELIATRIWRDGSEISFEATADDGRVVFTHGRARVSA